MKIGFRALRNQLRNQFGEQLLALLRNNRVLPPGTLKSFDDPDDPQNDKDPEDEKAQQTDQYANQRHVHKNDCDDVERYRHHDPSTAEEYGLDGPMTY